MLPIFHPYASVAEADTYWAAHIGGEAWYATAETPICESVKLASLHTASELLDTLEWSGCKTDAAQESAFPRSGMTDPDNFTIEPNSIPDVIKRATIKLALLVATDKVQPNSNRIQPPVKKTKAGDVEIEYFAHDTYTVAGDGCGMHGLQDAFATIMPLIAPYLRASKPQPVSISVCRA